MENKFATIRGDWSWGLHSTLGESHFFADKDDALSAAGAEVSGERFACADGAIALTPIVISAYTDAGELVEDAGYLVEDLRSISQ